jgi:2',3'-cyclic-nucleotide 2'-phosphodiesterase (5'-nucleotidase family)
MLWLDAGDQWTGTLESKLFNGKPLTVFYNDLGLNATAIGNHDFDMGVDILKTRMR